MSDESQELGITESKEQNIGDWYSETVQKSGMASYSGMSGFIILDPWGNSVWENIKGKVDGWFDETGVENAYFPLFIPESLFEQEKNIIEGFDPEVAWVTHGGDDELEERLAVRPTSESIITDHMGKKVRSHRDLPLRYNQWCGVVRWEATETKPFLRTREFLWQEGHGAFADEESAWEDVYVRLDQYANLYEDVLALPAMKGRKPEHDKFPGAETTTTIETLMPDGRSLQGATPHYLGTKFAEEYGVYYTDENEEEQVAHTTSWGTTWRTIGAVIMAHGDDQGLVLPPTIAPVQVVVVPIWTEEENKEDIVDYSETVADRLDDAGVRVEVDRREERSPGFKFNEWELKGVPIRAEIGSNELDDDSVRLVHRPDRETRDVDLESVATAVSENLDEVYDKLYDRAAERIEENTRTTTDRDELLHYIGKHGGYVRTGWCGNVACEEEVKDNVAAEIVMLELNEEAEPVTETCPVCGDEAVETAYYAKSH